MARPESIEQSELQYQELRKEILQNEQLVLQSMTAVLVLIGATITVAFSQFVPDDRIRALLFYGAELLAFFSLFHSATHQTGNFHLGYYLARFVEPNLDHINWEARIVLWRRQHPVPSVGETFFSGNRLPASALVAITWALGSYYVWRWFGPTRTTYGLLIIGATACFTAWLVFSWRRRFVNMHDYAALDRRYDEIEQLEANVPHVGRP
jgi:hypothetical protein